MPHERKPYDSVKNLLTHVHVLARITHGSGEEVETGVNQGASERSLREGLRRVEREDVGVASDDDDDDVVSDWGDRGTG